MNRWIIFVAAIWLTTHVSAQGTLADYQRAESISSLFKNKVFNDPHDFNWHEGSTFFWYKNTSRTGDEFLLVDVIKKTQKPAFDHSKLAKVLSQKLNKNIDAHKLPFDKIELSKDLKTFSFRADSAKLKCTLPSYACEVTEVIKPEKHDDDYYWGNAFNEAGGEPVPSPDGTQTAFIKNHNVYIRTKDKKEFQLSYDGAAGKFYSSYVQWSPDGKKLMAYKVTSGEKHLIYFVESSPKDQLQPKLCTREYVKPGDVLPHKQPQLFLVDEKKHVHISDSLFSNEFNIENIAWTKDSRAFTFEYNQRGHQRYSIVEVSAPSGEVRLLVDEHSKTFIDYSGKKYRYDVNDGKEIIWASERDGWNHLYLYDAITRKVKNQITKGNWVMRGVVHVDEQKRQIIFSASGVDEGQDPYLVYYFRINFDGTGLVRLTTEHANHNATFSPDFNYFVDQYSRMDLPTNVKLRSSIDGKEIMTLQQIDVADLKKAGWKEPEAFSAKGRDGVTDIWGVIIRPMNIDPNRKYPVVELIYAGPQDFYVPKDYNGVYRSLYAFAELGFIVVQIDGMGTSWRSKAFHDVCWKNLKDAGFPDRIAWMKAAAAKYPYMDINHVGITGGSAGGQNAAGAVIFHPEFYKAAVASCGCHDNRMDKMWWNEQWMGYPVGPHYAECSNTVNADKMQGNLMLLVGEMDDNVDPATTMQLANALIKAKKDFDLVVLPEMNHTGGGEFGERKRRDFFVKHLMGVTPPTWQEIYK
ncbi:MAG TPA: DPP IV N-terminal domain-containing protein [Cyclobacteriaceae bacterium]